jgi:hypothetical protein
VTKRLRAEHWSTERTVALHEKSVVDRGTALVYLRFVASRRRSTGKRGGHVATARLDA